jgi:hypothetical protein
LHFSLISSAQARPRMKKMFSLSAPGTGKAAGVTPDERISLS